ncbi:MAG: TRAP transporter substrate-binding protein DctP [Alphaproteobacteria bacterium]
MRLFRKLSCAIATGLMVVSAPTIAISADMTLKLAGVHPADHYGTQMMEQIKSEVESAGVGLTIELYPASQLGSGEELMEDAIRGNVDIVRSFVYAHRDPALEINSVPFLATSWDDMARVYGSRESAYSQIMAEILDRHGLKFLGNAADGPVGIITTKMPDNYDTVGDKGLNVRVWSSEVAKSVTEALGFRATTMNWSETLSAVQSGVVDGAHCCTAQLAYVHFAKSDIGSYYIPYNAIAETTTYYASKRTWEKLSKEQQDVIQEAVTKAAATFTAWARENDEGFLAKLKEKGFEVLPLTADQRAKMSDHIKNTVWPQLEGSVGKENLDRLRNDS